MSHRHYEESIQIGKQRSYNFPLCISDIVQIRTDSPELKEIYGSRHEHRFHYNNKKG